MKIRPVEAELSHTEGWTDMTRLIVACRNFSKAPETDMPCYSNALCVRVSVSPPQQRISPRWYVYRSDVSTQ
jgi:hypothetical protein